jgi:hypothetical protein
MYILTIMYAPKGLLGALRDWGKRGAITRAVPVSVAEATSSAGTKGGSAMEVEVKWTLSFLIRKLRGER